MMRGDILHYDEAQGFGFIDGEDGNRYGFAREDLRVAAQLSRGAAVEFQPNGGQARSVFPLHAAGPGAQAVAAHSPSQFGRAPARAAPPVAAATQDLGLWGYFRRAMTADYANFRGRARRKEYWGYYLFWFLMMVAVTAVGVGIDAARGGFDPNGPGPIAIWVLPGLFYLATLLPFIALTVRRHHDVGLSGWFVLLFFALSVVYIGGIILLVIALIPSQKHDNKWGPVPEGVPIPPPYVPPATG